MNFLALSQNADVESKSLETHLYRLRKKLNKLCPDILIVSDDEMNLIIRYFNQEED